jgi:malate dehydrogenase (oxaloacetate-decarboxylating)
MSLSTVETNIPNETLVDGIEFRKQHQGLFNIQVKTPVKDKEMLAVVYTPGVAKPCLEIEKNPLVSFDYTMRGNTIAVVSDGSSVYGLGNAGAAASIPMLESKSILHKKLAGIDAVPIAIDAENVEHFVEVVRQLSPTFGGFHLDGIMAPQCYEVEEKLKRALRLPVMHGEHSTAVVVVAALLNALKVVGKRLQDTTIVLHGAGTSGIGTARLLLTMGVKELRICDQTGRIAEDRLQNMNWLKSELARKTNPTNIKATLVESLKEADVYIGYQDCSSLASDALAEMAINPIVFAFSLPQAEISFQAAQAAGVAVYASQQAETPNHLNVAMAYPGIFRGALDVKATSINSNMLVAATLALAGMVEDADLSATRIAPAMLDEPVAATVARAVAMAAMETGVAQTLISPQSVEKNVIAFLAEGSAAWVKPENPNIPYASMTTDEKAMELRRRYQGVIETDTPVPMSNKAVFTQLHSLPNAVKACKAIQQDISQLYSLTCKKNLVAVITDGSAVLGLGNIGPTAGLPVMEGKSVLFKAFGGVEAFPICVQSQNTEELLSTIKALTPIFGGINLEDITAPRCFELEERLIAETDIPIFHDDQHGTAVVVVAAILNAVKAVNKPLDTVRIAVNGAGASALSVSRLLLKAGVKDIVICDTKGVIYKGRTVGMNLFKEKIADLTNLSGLQGTLHDAVRGADIFIGLSVPGALTPEMIATMAPDPIVLAMANPTPEIMPDVALKAGVKIMATGRSDFPNQVNNCLAFPGIFRGALDVQATVINDEMKLAAARAIAAVVTPEDITNGVIIPSIFDYSVPPLVAYAVAQSALETGVARITDISPEAIAQKLALFLKETVSA